MNSFAVLTFVLLTGAGCTLQTKDVGRSTTAANAEKASANVAPMPTPQAAPSITGTEEGKIVPNAFATIDFKNFSYPTSLRGNVRLEEGFREFEYPEGGGGDTFRFQDVAFADITGDGKEEAIVHLHLVGCGGSCDGGSHLFYFYAAGRERPRLLSRIETGSAAYGECGLKSFALHQGKLTLELFRICRFKGMRFQSMLDPNDKGGKFEAHSFTRFLFQFNGRRFVLKRREVFPFPPGDNMNYDETVSIGDH